MADRVIASSKEAEAAAENSRGVDTSTLDAPAYGEHSADQLYTEHIPIPNFGSGLPSTGDELELLPSKEPLTTGLYASPALNDPVPETTPSIPEPLPTPRPSGPLSLTLDKELIFPNVVPATALYSLNYTLNSMGNSITLRRSTQAPQRANGAPGKLIDKDLYSLTRPPISNLLFELEGKRQSTYPGTGTLQLKTGLRGRYWECKFKGKVMLKGRHGKWEDMDGKFVATEVNEVSMKSRKGKEKDEQSGSNESPGLNFELGVEDRMVDLMVAVWCTKIWCCETYEAWRPKGSSTQGRGSWDFW